MAKIEQENGYFVQESEVLQRNIGALQIKAMWFDHAQLLDNTITIYKYDVNKDSHYAQKIFEGSLAELISKLSTEDKPLVNYDEI